MSFDWDSLLLCFDDREKLLHNRSIVTSQVQPGVNAEVDLGQSATANFTITSHVIIIFPREGSSAFFSESPLDEDELGVYN